MLAVPLDRIGSVDGSDLIDSALAGVVTPRDWLGSALSHHGCCRAAGMWMRSTTAVGCGSRHHNPASTKPLPAAMYKLRTRTMRSTASQGPRSPNYGMVWRYMKIHAERTATAFFLSGAPIRSAWCSAPRCHTPRVSSSGVTLVTAVPTLYVPAGLAFDCDGVWPACPTESDSSP